MSDTTGDVPGGVKNMDIFTERYQHIPERHRAFLDRALAALARDPRVCGVAMAGSLASGGADEYSDIDLAIAVTAESHTQVMAERRQIAAGLGPLLGGFTGEHVGEPRLLICLYGPPLLHVDLKFAAIDTIHERVEEPVIVAERAGAMQRAYAHASPMPPAIDLHWIHERFYTWIHYGTDKALRGELFECLDMLTFLRAQVLGPMALHAAGYRGLDGQRVRRLETRAPRWSAALVECLGSHERSACLAALRRACELYGELRAALDADAGDASAAGLERAVIDYLDGAIAGATR